ncbi:MAG: cation diffusion facilitator family transporter [Planctomycetales bacterium]|nr:cation diffusion facilitator family transporter [Planctomycetales bacterium]
MAEGVPAAPTPPSGILRYATPRRPLLAVDLRRAETARALRSALALTAGMTAVEFGAGLWTGSLALLADAGHMLSDTAALGFALLASWLAGRPASPERSFGYYRLEILAALANGALLLAITGGVVFEALRRVADPPEILGLPMLLVALAGLAVNGTCAGILHRARSGGLNVRGALLHVVGDALGSIGAVLAAALVLATGFRHADPLVALGIAALILVSAVRLVWDAADVLVESVPENVDVSALETALSGVPGVRSVHDLHVWAVTAGFECLACHVLVEAAANGPEVLDRLSKVAAERFGIHHTTFQLETVDRRDRELKI